LDRFRHQQQRSGCTGRKRYSGGKHWKKNEFSLNNRPGAAVMLAELREHRDQTLAIRPDAPRATAALNALKVRALASRRRRHASFGKHFSEKLQQLIVSNASVEAAEGKLVRTCVGQGAFCPSLPGVRSVVIVQHAHGLTSIYGELGETQVKEGDLLARWTPSG